MTIATQDKDVAVVTCRADVRVRYFVYTYTYSYRGTETWRGNRLIGLKSATNDNGKRFVVTVVPDGDNLRVQVSGPGPGDSQERASRPDVWTTSYWRLAELRFRDANVPLLDSDTGRPIDGTLQYAGTNRISVLGQAQNCRHYRVTGDKINVDVWYDARDRLVRQETVEEGHRGVFELANLATSAR
jgi:hypothetical protein